MLHEYQISEQGQLSIKGPKSQCTADQEQLNQPRAQSLAVLFASSVFFFN